MPKFHHVLLLHSCWQWHRKTHVVVSVRITEGLGVSCFLSPHLVHCVVKEKRRKKSPLLFSAL